MSEPIVVVLSHYPDLFQRFRESLERYEPDARKLLVRDGELIQVPDSTNWWTIQGKEPFVYSRNVNLAWELTEPNDVILAGDDVVVEEPFVATLRKCAYDDPSVGISTIQLHGQSPFVCGYFKRSVIEAVGKMDERFVGYGKEDTDFCDRMEALGYRTQCVDLRARHTGGTSFWRRVHSEGKELQSLADMNNSLYEEKRRNG